MSGDGGSGDKKTIIQQMRSAEGRDDGRTRVYDVLEKETQVVSRHRWIGEEDEPEAGAATAEAAPAADRRTRVGRSSNTRVMDRRPPVIEEQPGQDAEGGRSASLSDILRSAVARFRELRRALKGIKVADKKRFARFIRIAGVIGLMLLLELGWFRFSAHVEGMPKQIEKTKKELSLTKEENALLKEETEALGDQNSIEELKASWERLKDKVEKAAEQTYY